MLREDREWRVSSWIDARLKAGTESTSLDELVRAADDLVREAYPTGRRRQRAELQYAIYPWSVDTAELRILDVSGQPGQFLATDMKDDDRQFRTATLDDLVEEIARGTPVAPNAMLRWIKLVQHLDGPS